MANTHYISTGAPFCHDIKIYTSVLDLMRDVQTEALPPLAYPSQSQSYIGATNLLIMFTLPYALVSLEQENREAFSDVTMRAAIRMPVQLLVCSTHIRVTSVSSCFCFQSDYSQSEHCYFTFHQDQITAHISCVVLQINRVDPTGGCQRYI